jgi:porin
MRCAFPSRCVASLVSIVVILLLTSPADAKRYTRYKKDDEKKPPSPTAVEPAPEPEVEEAPLAEGEMSEPEEPPGLLGYPLHGSDALKIEYIYTGDVFTNLRGGLNTANATEYLGLFDLALTADLQALRLLPGGTLFVLAENYQGRGITNEHVGDFQTLDNIDSGRECVQVSEFWWQRDFFEGVVSVRLGKQDANAEFGIVGLGGDFVNSSFGMPPNVPMPVWPYPAAGVLTFLQLAEALFLDVGVFDGAADGRSWGWSRTGETFTMGQLRTEWELGARQLPGDFHIGLWYHSGDPEDLADATLTHAGNYGVELGLDQLILRESGEDTPQGLGLFGQYSWAPADRNEIVNYIGGGLVYQGLIPRRDEDIAGLGVAHAVFSNQLPDQDHETALELFYKTQLNPWIVVQPDLQLIMKPNGDGNDALVAGLRFEAVL